MSQHWLHFFQIPSRNVFMLEITKPNIMVQLNYGKLFRFFFLFFIFNFFLNYYKSLILIGYCYLENHVWSHYQIEQFQFNILNYLNLYQAIVHADLPQNHHRIRKLCICIYMYMYACVRGNSFFNIKTICALDTPLVQKHASFEKLTICMLV